MSFGKFTKGLSQAALITSSTAGGMNGTYKGNELAKVNKYPHYDKLTTITRWGDNVCTLMVVAGCTFMGSMLTLPLVITSPFWYPFASKDVKEFFSINNKK
jgi:hypothetical protein